MRMNGNFRTSNNEVDAASLSLDPGGWHVGASFSSFPFGRYGTTVM